MRFIEILHSNERLGGEIGADQKTEAEINLILLRLKAKWRDLLPQRGIVAILSKWVQSEFFFPSLWSNRRIYQGKGRTKREIVEVLCWGLKLMSSPPKKRLYPNTMCWVCLFQFTLYVYVCVCVLRKYGLIGNSRQKIFRDSILHHIYTG